MTSFEFDLHPLGPEVAQAELCYPYADAENVLRAWREFALRAPDTVAPEFVLWSIPPDPGIPAALHGSKVIIVAGVFAGPPSEATPALAPLSELGTPLLDMSGVKPYVEVQSALDGFVPSGGRYYMKSHFLNELTDEAISTLLECDASRPNPETLIVIRTLGGAIARVGLEHSAYPHRAARFNLSLDPLWSDPALDDVAIGWARSTWNTLRPFATDGVYVNFAGLADDLRADARPEPGSPGVHPRHLRAPRPVRHGMTCLPKGGCRDDLRSARGALGS